MATANQNIDNTIKYSSRPGLKMLMFTVIFLITGAWATVKFDGYFTDFYKIKECRTDGYVRGDFMVECFGIKNDRYNFGSLYFGIQKNVLKNAREADVVVFGNSRTARSFSVDTLDQYFKEKGLTYMVLAAEGSSYKDAKLTLEAMKLKPKIVMTNTEIFYSDEVSDGFRDMVQFPDKYETRFRFFYLATQVQKKVCTGDGQLLRKFYCSGKRSARWRSAINGRSIWNKTVPVEKQKPIVYKPASRLNIVDRFAESAKEIAQHRQLDDSCHVFYLVNSPTSSPQASAAIAKKVGAESVFAHVDGLYTYDNSHLDRPHSEKWAAEFIKKLDPVIDTCLKKLGEPRGKTVDMDRISTLSKAGFVSWKRTLGATIEDRAAQAPDGNQTATVVTFGERPGSRIQGLYFDPPIEPGTTISFKVWMWSKDLKRVRMQLVRACSSATPLETARVMAELTDQPQEFELTYTFEHAHKCVAVSLMGLDGPIPLTIWNPSFSAAETPTGG